MNDKPQDYYIRKVGSLDDKGFVNPIHRDLVLDDTKAVNADMDTSPNHRKRSNMTRDMLAGRINRNSR